MIHLRSVRYRDWQSFYSLYTDELIERDLPFTRRLTKFECYVWFVSIVFKLRPGLIMSKAICLDNVLVGLIFLEQYSPVHQSANISFDLKPIHHGKGIGSSMVRDFCQIAFLNEKVNRINAIVRPENQKSKKLLSQLGFTKEAFLKQYRHFKGSLIDVFMYRLCKDEFKNN